MNHAYKLAAVAMVLAVLMLALTPAVALAQEETATDSGGGRPVVAHYIVIVLCVAAVVWAVCRTSYR